MNADLWDPPFNPVADFDKEGRISPIAAGRLREWWSDRGLTHEALDAPLAEPISPIAFVGRLNRAVHIGRALRHGA